MAVYECNRLVECVVTIEADDDVDLQRKLGWTFGTPDKTVENADDIVFYDSWMVVDTTVKGRGILTFTDDEIEAQVESTPAPWVED